MPSNVLKTEKYLVYLEYTPHDSQAIRSLPWRFECTGMDQVVAVVERAKKEHKEVKNIQVTEILSRSVDYPPVIEYTPI